MDEKKNSDNKIICIINPSAARNKWKRRNRLRKYLQENLPGKLVDIQGGKEDTIEIARKHSLDQNIVVVVGGDGTIADVLQGIIHSRREKRTILGLVPFGSGNAFRKSLGIPKDAKKAIPILSRGEYRDIDLIEVDGMVAGIASIGATAKATQVKLQHNIPGLFGHLLASRILFNYPRKEHEIELIDGIDDNGEQFDKKILKLQLYDCIVGKTKYFGYSWKVAPKAKIDDGYLDITFFETSGVKYLLLFPFIYFGVLQKRQKHFKAKKMIIRGENLPVQYNGEFLGVKNKFEFTVLPQALKVITPLKNNKNKFVEV